MMCFCILVHKWYIFILLLHSRSFQYKVNLHLVVFAFFLFSFSTVDNFFVSKASYLGRSVKEHYKQILGLDWYTKYDI